MAQDVTHDELLKLLHYDPETGYFTWKLARCGQVPAGARAGSITAYGYRRINIRHKLYTAHKLAVFYMTGEWPRHDVDHKRGNRDDNRWVKIRELSRAENMQNLQGAHKDNATGFLGVAPIRDRFAAYIRYDGRNRYLGTFNTPEEASRAYLAAKALHHPGSMLSRAAGE